MGQTEAFKTVALETPNETVLRWQSCKRKWRVVEAKIISIVLVALCFSCILPDRRLNATLQCNVIEVPRRGVPHRYQNELVRFAWEYDSLKIHSQHVNLDFMRNQLLEKTLPAIDEVRKQFVFTDQYNDQYKVVYTEQTWKSKIYLYLYVINLKHPAPVYMFTNNPYFSFNPKGD